MFRTHEVSPLKYLGRRNDHPPFDLYRRAFGNTHGCKFTLFYVKYRQGSVCWLYGASKDCICIDWAKTRLNCCSNQNLSSTAVGSHDSGIYLRIGCTRINIVATRIKMTKTMTKAEEEQSAQWHCFKMSQSENSRNLKAFCSSSHQDKSTILTIMVTMTVMMLTMLTT